jgi:LEA14-like dessication related protein
MAIITRRPRAGCSTRDTAERCVMGGRLVARLALVAAAMGLGGCSKPRPPSITSVKPTSIAVTPAGIGIGWDLGMKNDSGVAIPVQSVRAHVVLDGAIDLGTATVSEAVVLAAEHETIVPVSVNLAWSNLGQLGQLTTTPHDVAYQADGMVTLGGSLLNVTVPFATSGTLTQQDLTRGALQGLPLRFGQ